MSESATDNLQEAALQRAYRAMLLAGSRAGADGDCSDPLDRSLIGQAPHVPDEPTEAEVLCLVEHLAYSIAYFVTDYKWLNGYPGGKQLEFRPVMGVCWIAPLRPDVVTVYIDSKAYLMPSAWLPAQWQAQASGR